MKNIPYLLLLILSIEATAQVHDTSWVLVFSDEFEGTTVDTSKWDSFVGVPRDLDYTSQKAWHTAENIVIKDGKLTIISKAETLNHMPVVTSWDPYTAKYDTFNYSTGELWSKQNFGYGKFEARIKVPKEVGAWPAFWLYGSNPTWNEIDVFEFYGAKTKLLSMTAHYNGHMSGQHAKIKDAATDFHIYTVIYEENKIEWYVDGILKRRMERSNLLTAKETKAIQTKKNMYSKMLQSFPKDPMAIIFNTAIQTGKNAPTSDTTFPLLMEVDWVRYYQR
jgi:beta-glucanase (GH16 family)